jgi:hypothetical protein
LGDDLVGLLNTEEAGNRVEPLIEEIKDVKGRSPAIEEVADEEANEEGQGIQSKTRVTDIVPSSAKRPQVS